MEPVDYLDWVWDYNKEKEVFTDDLEKFDSYQYKSGYDWHLFYVFHDIDFLVYNDVIMQHYIPPVGFRQVDGSIKFEPLASKKDEYEQDIHALCIIFNVQRADLEKFNALPVARWRKPIYQRKKLKINKPVGKIHLELDAPATTAGIVKEYKLKLKSLGIKQPRRREYLYPDLVYAVRANLILDKTPDEIFADFQAGNLRGYRKKGVKAFTTSHSLMRYYNKYKTDTESRSAI